MALSLGSVFRARGARREDLTHAASCSSPSPRWRRGSGERPRPRRWWPERESSSGGDRFSESSYATSGSHAPFVCNGVQARYGVETDTFGETRGLPEGHRCRPRRAAAAGRCGGERAPPRHSVVRRGGGAGGIGGGSGGGREVPRKPVTSPVQFFLVFLAFAWMFAIVILPLSNIFVQAFKDGIGPFVSTMVDYNFLQAVKMTLICASIAVPLNTVFGVACALYVARNEFPGKRFVITLLDLPFSISPVIAGLMLVLLYGRNGLFAPILKFFGLQIVFALPGMVLATMFVTLPFVAKELIPLLEEMDVSDEEAARTLGANEMEVFWNVTLPNIRWGLLYGVVLANARAMGEFGAVSVISGNIIGRTQTLTLFVESSYKEYATGAAFSAAVVLCMLALVTLFLKNWLEMKQAEKSKPPPDDEG